MSGCFYFVRYWAICVRGGFRRGDLVTYHPLFSDRTLQSQILVIESLLLTSVSKFIRKYFLSRQFSYMYSSCSNPATPLVKFNDNFFQKKLSINKSSFTSTWFRALSWDNVGFLRKSQCDVRGSDTAYGMFYACKCSVTRCSITGIFCHQIQKRRDWHHTWWLPGDSFLFRQIYWTGKSKLSVLEKWKQRYCDFYEIYLVLCLLQQRNLLTNSQKVRGEAIMVERTNSQGLDKVIHVYLLILLNSVLTR